MGVDGLTLSIGDTFTPTPITIPAYRKPIYTLESDNESVAEISEKTIVAVENGDVTVTATAKSFGNVFTDNVEVTVKDLEYNLTPSRTATDLVLARIPTTIEVDEEFSAQAYVLSEVTAEHPYSYSYYDDNLVKFTSDNEAVCRVKNGVLLGVSTGSAIITVSDIDENVSKTFSVTVTEKEELTYTESEVMNVVAGDYDWTDAETTTLAISEILTSASQNGYKKVVFPKMIYEVSPAYGSIYIPTNMIVDFSDSVIQILESALTSTGYHMFIMEDVNLSILENATIYGERYLIDGTGAESCVSVVIRGNSYRSGVRNCTLNNSPGFNCYFSNTNRKVVGVQYDKIVAGGLDATGAEIDAEYTYRSAYTKISGYLNQKNKFALGNMQGFQGYAYMSARVYNIYFYDSSYNFISKLENCLQYYFYEAPTDAYYARITYNWDSLPTSGDQDYHAIAHIYSLDMPYACFVRNCLFENNYSTAIVPNGGESTLIEDCVFNDNGVRDPASHIDWEDGRNNNKGHILRNCTFTNGGPVMVVGSDGLVMHNNSLNNSYLDLRSEVQNSRVWLNQFIGNRKSLIYTKTDMVFSQNYGCKGATYELINSDGVDFAIRETENKF